MPNQDQITSLLRMLLVVIGTLLVSHGYTTDGNWTALSGALVTIIPIIWAMFVHSDTGKIKAVENLPDVESITVVPHPNPNSAVSAALESADHPKVVNG